MRRSFAALSLLSLLCTSPSFADDKAPPAKRPPPRRPVVVEEKEPTREPVREEVANECAVVSASASYVAYGYNHVVTLKNGCKKPVECAVWTDVDPDARSTLSLRPGESGEVVTRRGSPSREVNALKQCTFR